jgi:NCS1 family nucleobase:cation symporter-1
VSARGRAGSTVVARTAFVIVFTIVATVLAAVAGAHLETTFENITLFLLYLLVPWTAINLTDYYLVRRGQYDIQALFERRGPYGLISWPSVLLYLITIGIEIPFVNATLLEGPIAKALGGADIAWIIGLILPSVAYWLLARARHVPDPPPEPALNL